MYMCGVGVGGGGVEVEAYERGGGEACSGARKERAMETRPTMTSMRMSQMMIHSSFALCCGQGRVGSTGGGESTRPPGWLGFPASPGFWFSSSLSMENSSCTTSSRWFRISTLGGGRCFEPPPDIKTYKNI